MEDLQWNYGLKEYKETFSKVKETKAAGPSGLTMPHWKAACHDDDLARLHAEFIRIPFQYGVPLNRWKLVTHTMIEKKDKPYVDKLRKIQLTEVDYNGGLKYIIGRKLRDYCETNGG